jgi:hypothetical protein
MADTVLNTNRASPSDRQMAAAILDGPPIARILFPYMAQRTRDAIAAGGRFVYYTTADTAARILTNRQVWMRSTTAMNDYMEVEHGFECLNAAYNAEPGQVLNSALDACFSGVAAELRDLFNAWLPGIRQETYMLCVSEHLPEEDQHGRLSMWRAYGGQAGIALVLNGGVMLRESDALGAYSSPVAYLNPDAFAAEFGRIAKTIADEAGYIRTLDRETVKMHAFNMLRFAVLCTKHPGFHEEREWRVVASPTMYPSPLLTSGVEVVRGIPQTVLKIDLQNHPDEGLTGLAIPELLNRIIIGPCEFPLVVLNAFRQLLRAAEVPEPESKVFVSDIPLRHLGA